MGTVVPGTSSALKVQTGGWDLNPRAPSLSEQETLLGFLPRMSSVPSCSLSRLHSESYCAYDATIGSAAIDCPRFESAPGIV
jgi:hypothetical protein